MADDYNPENLLDNESGEEQREGPGLREEVKERLEEEAKKRALEEAKRIIVREGGRMAARAAGTTAAGAGAGAGAAAGAGAGAAAAGAGTTAAGAGAAAAGTAATPVGWIVIAVIVVIGLVVTLAVILNSEDSDICSELSGEDLEAIIEMQKEAGVSTCGSAQAAQALNPGLPLGGVQ